MGLFHRNEVDASIMVKLTEDGKKAIDSDSVKDMKQYAVVAALDQHSPQSMSSLAKETRLNIFLAKKTVERLQKQGMVCTVDYNNQGAA